MRFKGACLYTHKSECRPRFTSRVSMFGADCKKRQKKREMKLNGPRRHPLEKRIYCVWMRRAKADCDLTEPRFRFWVEEMANERDGIDVGSGF